MASPRKLEQGDEWWQFLAFVESFNHHRSTNVAASRWKCIDKIMSTWVPDKGTGTMMNAADWQARVVARNCVCHIPNPKVYFWLECPNLPWRANWMTGTGEWALPNLTYIIRKPEPLGMELKAVACPRTGIMLGLEIQRSKEKMALQELHKKLGATTLCVAQMSGLTSQAGQPREDRPYYEIYQGDSWFSSV